MEINVRVTENPGFPDSDEERELVIDLNSTSEYVNEEEKESVINQRQRNSHHNPKVKRDRHLLLEH